MTPYPPPTVWLNPSSASGDGLPSSPSTPRRVDGPPVEDRAGAADETIPEVIDRLVGLSGRLAADQLEPPVWELTSDRVVTGSDPLGQVEVTVCDYAVRAVRIDPGFLVSGDLPRLEETIAVAATAALKQFIAEEMAEMASASTPMGEVHAQLLRASADVTAAFDRHMDILDAKVRAL